MTTEEIKNQALEVGMTEKSASTLSSQVWGFNLKSCVVGGKGNYQFGRNEIYVLCYFETDWGKKWELEYVCRFSTGAIIRSLKAKKVI